MLIISYSISKFFVKINCCQDRLMGLTSTNASPDKSQYANPRLFSVIVNPLDNHD